MAFIDESVSPGKTRYDIPANSPFAETDMLGVQVYEVTTTATDKIVPPIVGKAGIETIWISMMSESEWFIIWGRDTTDGQPDVPDPNAHVNSSSADKKKQCIRVPPDFEYQRKIVAGDVFRLIHRGSGTINVRLEVVSPIPG
jgi:hypothetical protein